MKIGRAILNALAAYAPGGDGSLHRREFRMLFFRAALALVLVTPGAVLAEESGTDQSEFVPATLDPGLPLPFGWHDLVAQNSTGATDTPTKPSSEETPAKPRKPLRFEETKAGKSYLLPAWEIIGFNF